MMEFEEHRQALEQDAEYQAALEELKPILDLADDILRLRLARGWSQSELAEQTGTRQANISKIESGLANPTLKFLQKLAGALDAELKVTIQPVTRARAAVGDTLAIETSVAQASVQTLFWSPDWPQRTGTNLWDDRNSTPIAAERVSV